MTSIKKMPIPGTHGSLTNWRLHSTEVEVELEKLDRRAGHQYVPMDVYLDPGTIDEHFHVSSICDRWARTHLNNAR
jgi:hypothetical protein